MPKACNFPKKKILYTGNLNIGAEYEFWGKPLNGNPQDFGVVSL